MRNYFDVPERRPWEGTPPSGLDGPAEGIVVRKYGGSSLATPELVHGVAQEVAELVRTGKHVVVVVSAMGNTTDELVALAGQFADQPDPRELDQMMATGEQLSAAALALALTRRGVKAVSLSGDQAGIVVGGEPGSGTIVRIDPTRIVERMRDEQVVVVAGFQGRDVTGELLTLGRGGSDTTAVALAAALGSPACDICTDVQGVRTADPRIVPETQPVPTIAYDVMTELAHHGARVLHPRSVELAERHGVSVRVLHSSRPGPGTTVEAAEPLEGGPEVIGVAHERDVRQVRLMGPGLLAGGTARVLARLAASGLRPDTLTWPDPDVLWFTVRGSAPLAGPVRELAEELGALWEIDEDLGAVSVVGTGLLDDPGHLSALLRVVGELGVTVPTLATSPSRLTAVLPADRLDTAVRALHEAFGLNLPAEARR
ncbi:aspartate kinase [Amycolatopsis sp. NPDC059021]|uniref:aspartate kinase n=1 Tax=Amycolatopsis sp. NPDC059021 TaxID=3346704 RepID=UPI00366FC54E